MPVSLMTRDLQRKVEAQRRSSQPELHVVSLPKTLKWLPLRYGTEVTPPRRPPRFQDDLAPPLPSHLHIFTLFSIFSPTGFFEFFKHSKPFAVSAPLHMPVEAKPSLKTILSRFPRKKPRHRKIKWLWLPWKSRNPPTVRSTELPTAP